MDIKRDFFLREFTKELIINSRKPGTIIILPEHPVKTPYITAEENYLPSQYEISLPTQLKIPSTEQLTQTKQNISSSMEFKPRIYTTTMHPPAQSMPRPIPKIIMQQTRINLPQQTAPSHIASITPAPQPLPAGFSLGKVDPLIADNRITNIECPGPGRYVFVKIMGKANTTKITLSEDEIKDIIGIFSQTAKIPFIGGIFKAAVGNLVITAVASDFVGSRFIINKYTPYSILEQQP